MTNSLNGTTDQNDRSWQNEYLKGVLQTGIANVTFLKKDGTQRNLLCTLLPSELPAQTDLEEAVQNEGASCFSLENIEYIKANSNTQFLSFDSDDVGVANSQQITKMHGFNYINVPREYLAEGIKDWSDLAKIHGMQTIENYLKQKQLI